MKSSYHMEKEGLVRAMKVLKKFKIGLFVTDHHKQIAKWLRENAPDIDHHYDIWHLANVSSSFLYNKMLKIVLNSFLLKIALSKKTDAVSKEKECELAGKWKRSLVNHLYWSAVCTPDGDGETS